MIAFLRSSGVKRGAANAGALALSHGANAVLPLIAFPHLLLVAGADHYSDVVVAESISVLVLTVSLYSFEVDGVQALVGMKVDKDAKAVSQVFSEILVARLLLFLAASLVALILTRLITPERVPFLLAWLALPLAVVVQSSWLFNGLERNLPVSIAVTVSRAFAGVAILLLINSPQSAWLLPVLISGPALLASMGLIVFVGAAWRIRPVPVEMRSVGARLRGGRPVFFSSVSVFLYRDLNVLLLGSAGANAAAISAYSIAEKVVKGLQSAARPLNLAFFPVALRRLESERRPGRSALVKLSRLAVPQVAFVLALAGAGVVAWAVAAGYLSVRIETSDLGAAPGLAVLMAPVLVFGVANFMLGTVGLNRLGDSLYFFKITAAVGVANVVLGFWAALHWEATGMALCFAASEAALFGAIFYRYRFEQGRD